MELNFLDHFESKSDFAAFIFIAVFTRAKIAYFLLPSEYSKSAVLWNRAIWKLIIEDVVAIAVSVEIVDKKVLDYHNHN